MRANQLVLGAFGMRGGLGAAALIAGLTIGLAACEGEAQGVCASTRDVAAKVTALTDDIAAAQSSGKIDTLTAAAVSGQIMDAGAKHRDRRSYCIALDKIRQDTGL